MLNACVRIKTLNIYDLQEMYSVICVICISMSGKDLLLDVHVVLFVSIPHLQNAVLVTKTHPK